ncbi:hypothetical protein [Halobacterium salinarum]|uniref:hypothetical protein n=1 Tax=Halobacterium salinarum TaxID=2242 RepID=UPI002553000B|nr:hypothetical protein [Halobacterium salinarum]MDL0144538.1 hypothetical protein [Halobacterium salinarum]
MTEEDIESHYQDIIQDLAKDGIEYIRIDMDSVGFPEERDEEFGEMARVVTIKDVEESDILRPLIANISQSNDLESQFGVEVLDETEAVSYRI